jgi:ABC-type lipoprotein export system ATPase subunit
VLKDITLAVGEGESVAIVGPSGSGKSTLLNIIGALDRPTDGQVRIRGRDLADLNDRELAIVRNRELGFIFQLHHLLPQCTVFENVLIPTLASRSGNAETRTRAGDLLRRVGLGERMDYLPGQLSGGERQRVAVIRALINKPGLLLADEPTGSLDRSAAETLGRLLIELNSEQNTALVVVTHSTKLAEQMQKTYQLVDGHLEQI